MSLHNSYLVQLARVAVAGDTASALAVVRRARKRLQESDPSIAVSLGKILDDHKQSILRSDGPYKPIPTDQDSRLQLARLESTVNLHVEPTWPASVAATLGDVILERENADDLAEYDLAPSRTLLFTGPPGVGKTLAARWIARELRLPLLTLDLSAVMSSFLGRTGNNLRTVLDFAGEAPCVLLLDEFDAIAKRRSDAVEVGELKRLVNVLLQSIDDWPVHGLLIAATNHPDLLDPAIWRRFDVVIEFPLPSKDDLQASIRRILHDRLDLPDPYLEALAEIVKGRSFADVERGFQRALRRALVHKQDFVESVMSAILEDSEGASTSARLMLATALVRQGISQREAHRLTGVSRDTIRKHMKNELGDTNARTG